jgi:hypothetical protein
MTQTGGGLQSLSIEQEQQQAQRRTRSFALNQAYHRGCRHGLNVASTEKYPTHLIWVMPA